MLFIVANGEDLNSLKPGLDNPGCFLFSRIFSTDFPAYSLSTQFCKFLFDSIKCG